MAHFSQTVSDVSAEYSFKSSSFWKGQQFPQAAESGAPIGLTKMLQKRDAWITMKQQPAALAMRLPRATHKLCVHAKEHCLAYFADACSATATNSLIVCSGKGGARGAGMPAYHLTATTSGNMQHALRPHMLHAVIPRVERLLQVLATKSG